MAIRVAKRQTKDGPRYSISGLTFGQAFRVKSAMFDCEKKMEGIAKMCAEEGNLVMARDFKDYAKVAHDVAVALRDSI